MIWELLLTALLAILSKLWRSACVKYCSLWRSEEGSWSAWLTLSVVVCGNVRSQCDSKSCTSTVCKIYIIPNRAIQSKCIYKYMYIYKCTQRECTCMCTPYVWALVQVELPSKEDTFIQISTPKGKKRRRISSTVIEQRLSIIPRLDRSFVQKDEEDFEVHVCIHCCFLK